MVALNRVRVWLWARQTEGQVRLGRPRMYPRRRHHLSPNNIFQRRTRSDKWPNSGEDLTRHGSAPCECKQTPMALNLINMCVTPVFWNTHLIYG